MLKFTLIFTLIAVSAAVAYEQRTSGPSLLVVDRKKEAPVAILRSSNDVSDDGTFSYSFETENGIKVQSRGAHKQLGRNSEQSGMVSEGSYSYTAPDGTPISVKWVADENGYRATGDHLPTPPPMPAHVVKMLADLRASGRLGPAAPGSYY